jgi:hypothetical protein
MSGRGSVVGRSTPYSLHGPGTESRYSQVFFARPDPPGGSTRLRYNGYRIFPEVMASGA